METKKQGIPPEPPIREGHGFLVLRRNRKPMTTEEAERLLDGPEPEEDPDC